MKKNGFGLGLISLAAAAMIFAPVSLNLQQSRLRSATPEVEFDALQAFDARLLFQRVSAGQDARLRMLDAMENLERIERREATVWQSLLRDLGADQAAGTDEELGGFLAEERRIRTVVLPQLSERQAALRQQEWDAEAALFALGADAAAIPVTRDSIAQAMALQTTRNWSQVIDQMQRSFQSRAYYLQTQLLSRFGRQILSERLRGRLADLDQRRAAAQDELDSAEAEWIHATASASLDEQSETLDLVRQVLEDAQRTEGLVYELRGRAGTSGNESSRALLASLSDRVLASLSNLSDWAMAKAGEKTWAQQGFLHLPDRDRALDAEAAALERQRVDVVGELLTSLQEQVDSLLELRRMTEARDALMQGSRAYLPDAAEHLAPLREDAAELWNAIDDAAPRLEAFPDIARSADGASAAEQLGVWIEALVEIESALWNTQLGLLSQPAAKTSDPRLGAGREAWESDLLEYLDLSAQWDAWKSERDLAAKQDAEWFVALDALMADLTSLWQTRVEALLSTDPDAESGDAITELLDAMLTQAAKDLSSYKSQAANVAEVEAFVEEDPLLRAFRHRTLSQRWALASARSGNWNVVAAGLEKLHRLPAAIATAADPAAATDDKRIAALVQISDTFDYPWTLERKDGDFRASITIGDAVFAVESLLASLDAADALRLQKKASLDWQTPGSAWQFAAWFVRTASAATPGGNSDPSLLSRAGHVGSSAVQGIGNELYENSHIYIMITADGCVVGAVCGFMAGGPPGAMAGATAGGAAAGEAALWAAGQDAVFGAVKGTTRGLTDDPETIAWVDEGVEKTKDVMLVVSLAKLAQGVYRVGARGLTGAAKSLSERLKRIGDLGKRIAQQKDVLRNLTPGTHEYNLAMEALRNMQRSLARAQAGFLRRLKDFRGRPGYSSQIAQWLTDLIGGGDHINKRREHYFPEITERIDGLRIAPAVPAPVEPGGTVSFQVFLDKTIINEDGNKGERKESLPVTAEAAFSGGTVKSPGQVQFACDQEGQTVAVTASHSGQTANATVQVKAMPLNGFELAASTTTAAPGDSVSFTGRAIYQNANCPQRQRDIAASEITWTPPELAGGSLAIACTDGGTSKTVTGSFAGRTAPQTITVSALPLQSLTIGGPATADPGTSVGFTAQASFGSASCPSAETRQLGAGDVQWTIDGRSGGPSVNLGCELAGKVVNVSAAYQGQTQNHTVAVPELPLTALQIGGLPGLGRTGQRFQPTVTGRYALNACEKSVPVAGNTTWSVSGNATMQGGTLVIGDTGSPANPAPNIVVTALAGGLQAQHAIEPVGAKLVGLQVLPGPSVTLTRLGQEVAFSAQLKYDDNTAAPAAAVDWTLGGPVFKANRCGTFSVSAADPAFGLVGNSSVVVDVTATECVRLRAELASLPIGDVAQSQSWIAKRQSLLSRGCDCGVAVPDNVANPQAASQTAEAGGEQCDPTDPLGDCFNPLADPNLGGDSGPSETQIAGAQDAGENFDSGLGEVGDERGDSENAPVVPISDSYGGESEPSGGTDEIETAANDPLQPPPDDDITSMGDPDSFMPDRQPGDPDVTGQGDPDRQSSTPGVSSGNTPSTGGTTTPTTTAAVPPQGGSGDTPPPMTEICRSGLRIIQMLPHATDEDDDGNTIVIDARETIAAMGRAMASSVPPGFRAGLNAPRVVAQKQSMQRAVSTMRSHCKYPVADWLFGPGTGRSSPPTGVLTPQKGPDGRYHCCMLGGQTANLKNQPWFVYDQSYSVR